MVDTGVKTGVRIRYEDPRAVGADRIVDAAAVQQLYGGPACVVDFGTATTFDAISAEGDYLGGAIAPGIGIAAEALFPRTAKLPRVDLQRPPGGHRPQHRPRHAVRPALRLCRAWWRAWWPASANELGPEMKVIATGGLAEIIAQRDQRDPDHRSLADAGWAAHYLGDEPLNAFFMEIQTQTGWGHVLQGFAAWCRPQPGWLTLDVGCGPGLLPALLARRGCRAFGVDMDKASLAQCLYAALAQADAEWLPFPAESFTS